MLYDNQDKLISNSFIESLYEQGLIEKRIFSLYLAADWNFRDVSMFTAGGDDLDKYANGKSITWNPVTDPTYWTTKLA